MKRSLLVIAALGFAAASVPLVASDFSRSLALSCLMYAALATSWAMFCGATRYISLGTSAFFGLGAYFCAWTLAALPWPLVIIGGAIGAASFAALAGIAILHLRGTYFAVLTFGLSELVRHAVTYAEKQYAGTVGRVLATVPSALTVYYTVLVLALLSLVIAVAVRHSRFGLALSGIGADEQRAQTLGVPTRWIKVAVAGAVGAAMAVRWTYVDPPSVFNPFIGFQTVLIAMIGGATNLFGPVVAAIVFSLLAEYLRLEFPYIYMVLLGVLLVVAVLYLPRGLATLWTNRRWRTAS
jgi:branched-chain amino acid transport system permease protein